MNGVQTRFKCKLDVKRCKRFVFPPSSLLPRSNALKTKAIRYFQTDQTLTRIVSSPLQPQYTLTPDIARHSLCLALDDVQDPGNLGTIIRLADWFGIEDIICSQNTVDVYNPKTVQATMGGIARVRVHYTSLPDFIRSQGKEIPVFGTFLDGQNMYEQPLSANGLIVMGNEGNGIGKEVEALINRKLYIPNYPQGQETSESLNVAIATAVICAEFRRQAAWK